MMRAAVLFASTLILFITTGAQAAGDDSVVTLYRSSVVTENARYHIATFDAQIKGGSGGTAFDDNWANCQIAAELFQKQPGVKVRYWCEKGRHRK